MSGVLTLPRLGETMEEGRVVTWLVAPGEAYKRGDALLEVETDKTIVEVPALGDGELTEILVPEGAQVRVGDPLARLSGAADAAAAPAPKPHAMPLAPPGSAVPLREEAPPARAGRHDKVRATPLARRLARDAGLDICDIPGSGRRGRIERGDVECMTQVGESGPLAHSLSGPENGTPVLLLHGFAGDRSVWSAISAGLVRAGRRILAPDLPGHGTTGTEATIPEDLSTGLSRLVSDTLAARPHVVAHSLGAVPATALAAAGKATSLTLIAPAGLGLRIDATFVQGLAAARLPGEVAHLLDRMTEAPLPLSSDALADIAETLSRGRLSTLAAALVGATGQTVSLRAELARLAEKIPVRILAPHRDQILDWADMVTVSPRIAVHHLPGAGHMAAWDAPTEVLEILCHATES
ncbi:MAG: alpha/beta fold hydrolase [Pseudomonadota bacterium]